MDVLIVDDDNFTLNLVEHSLNNVGYEAVRAHNGQEALAALRRGDSRLLITDWEMPGMNGLDLLPRRAQRRIFGICLRGHAYQPRGRQLAPRGASGGRR